MQGLVGTGAPGCQFPTWTCSKHPKGVILHPYQQDLQGFGVLSPSPGWPRAMGTTWPGPARATTTQLRGENSKNNSYGTTWHETPPPLHNYVFIQQLLEVVGSCRNSEDSTESRNAAPGLEYGLGSVVAPGGSRLVPSQCSQFLKSLWKSKSQKMGESK